MFKTIEFPAGVPDLTTGLTHVDRDALALGENYLTKKEEFREISNIYDLPARSLSIWKRTCTAKK